MHLIEDLFDVPLDRLVIALEPTVGLRMKSRDGRYIEGVSALDEGQSGAYINTEERFMNGHS